MVITDTKQAYLEQEAVAETRSEYYGGKTYPKIGEEIDHVRVVREIACSLHEQLNLDKCEVFVSQLRVLVEECDGYFYPDVVVVCGEPQLTDSRPPSLLNPIVIIEVLSESTEQRDRGEKFACYRTLPSLQEYLIVSSSAYSVEHYVRVTPDKWMLTIYQGSDAVLELPSIRCSVPLREVYARTDFVSPTHL